MAAEGPQKEQSIPQDLVWDLPDSAIEKMRSYATELYLFLQIFDQKSLDVHRWAALVDKPHNEAKKLLAEFNEYKKTLTPQQCAKLKKLHPNLDRVTNIHFGDWSSSGESDADTIKEVIDGLNLLITARKQYRILKFSQVNDALQPLLVDDAIRLIADFDALLTKPRPTP